MKLSSRGIGLFLILLGAIICLSTAKNIDEKTRKSSFDVPNNNNLDFTDGEDEVPVVTNTTISEAINITVHRGFLHGFGESISVILVSEIGDKTFFIAAILAMTNNKLTVFLAAISALAVMTVMSALLGWVVTTFIPREVTYYTCTAIMFLFGLKMLWEAWRMDDNEMEETQREVEQELARRGSISSTSSISMANEQCKHGQKLKENDTTKTSNSPSKNQQGIQNVGYEKDVEINQIDIVVDDTNKIDAAVNDTKNIDAASDIKNRIVVEQDSELAQSESNGSDEPKSEDNIPRWNNTEVPQADETKYENKPVMKTVKWTDNVIDNSCKENSWFGKKCIKIFKLFVNCFSMTFIAEWGDRSQLATIVLAGFNDVGGVCVGGVLGHTICTSGAVVAGALIARYISVRKVTFVGALVFLGFAIASIFIDPTEEVPSISGYNNSTRILNKNVSLTLMLENNEYEY